jgi:hypothetical protein
MTNWPNRLKSSPVSTTTRPVTHTAEVASNRAFRKPMLSPVLEATGRVRSKAPIMIMEAKPSTKTCVGKSLIVLLAIFSLNEFTLLFQLHNSLLTHAVFSHSNSPFELKTK